MLVSVFFLTNHVLQCFFNKTGFPDQPFGQGNHDFGQENHDFGQGNHDFCQDSGRQNSKFRSPKLSIS